MKNISPHEYLTALPHHTAKTFALTAVFLFTAIVMFAQTGAVSINHTGTQPDQSAILDLSAADRGLLPPKMSTASRDGIPSPATGLIIFNTTTGCLELYSGSSWLNIKCTCEAPPDMPGSITGNTSVCQGANGVSYAVTPVASVTYVWDYSGTGFTCASGCSSNSIIADFSGSATSGTLSVTPSNACGDGTPQTLAITVNTGPSAPTAATHEPSGTNTEWQIIWNWNTVAGATGYKYNTTDDYGTATDNGADTSYTETGLGCNTDDTLYVWAYNSCGNSSSTILTETSSACIYVFQPDSIDAKDAFWGTNTPHVNGWCCRTSLSFGGWGDWYYDYIEFDLSGAPSAAQTTSAEIWLYAPSPPPNDPALKMSRITEPWNETGAGGYPEAGVSSSDNPASVFYTNMVSLGGVSAGWKVTDITTLYKDWKDGTYPNYGVKIAPTYNSHTNGKFYSSEYTDDPTLRPKLVVYY